MLPRRAVERAFDEAEFREVLDARAIEDVLARAGGHRGARRRCARSSMTIRPGPRGPATTSRRRSSRSADAASLPQPEVNAWIPLEPTGYEADFLWRAQRLIAETDGGAAHTTSRAFEHDRRRDQRLMLAGFRVVRFPWQQVFDEPRSVEATVRELLYASISPRRIA